MNYNVVQDVCSSQDMDLNSVLQAGVVERVAAPVSSSDTVSSTCGLDDLDFDSPWELMSVEPILQKPKVISLSSIQPQQSIDHELTTTSSVLAIPATSLATTTFAPIGVHQLSTAPKIGLVKTVGTAVTVKPRATILASQLPQPILASRLVDSTKQVSSTLTRPQLSTVVISAGEIVNSDVNTTNNNIKTSINNNSLLRTALIGNKPMASSAPSYSVSTSSPAVSAVMATSSFSPLLTSSTNSLSSISVTPTITSSTNQQIVATQLSKGSGLRKAVLTMVGGGNVGNIILKNYYFIIFNYSFKL